MPQWVSTTTRWAIYLRDDLSCTYCRVTLADILAERGENFLTLDHLRARTKGGDNGALNLVTACYECNSGKRNMAIARFCREYSLKKSRVYARIRTVSARDISSFRPAAKLLLGQVPGLPGGAAESVVDHDWIVKRRWGDSVDSAYWAHLKTQEELFCKECGQPRDGRYDDCAAEASWAGREAQNSGCRRARLGPEAEPVIVPF
tara:strand:+ start:226 stop:837 length:612 start_codon:yes stop_codon:yes gene_type:complete